MHEHHEDITVFEHIVYNSITKRFGLLRQLNYCEEKSGRMKPENGGNSKEQRVTAFCYG